MQSLGCLGYLEFGSAGFVNFLVQECTVGGQYERFTRLENPILPQPYTFTQNQAQMPNNSCLICSSFGAGGGMARVVLGSMIEACWYVEAGSPGGASS